MTSRGWSMDEEDESFWKHIKQVRDDESIKKEELPDRLKAAAADNPLLFVKLVDEMINLYEEKASHRGNSKRSSRPSRISPMFEPAMHRRQGSRQSLDDDNMSHCRSVISYQESVEEIEVFCTQDENFEENLSVSSSFSDREERSVSKGTIAFELEKDAVEVHYSVEMDDNASQVSNLSYASQVAGVIRNLRQRVANNGVLASGMAREMDEASLVHEAAEKEKIAQKAAEKDKQRKLRNQRVRSSEVKKTEDISLLVSMSKVGARSTDTATGLNLVSSDQRDDVSMLSDNGSFPRLAKEEHKPENSGAEKGKKGMFGRLFNPKKIHFRNSRRGKKEARPFQESVKAERRGNFDTAPKPESFETMTATETTCEGQALDQVESNRTEPSRLVRIHIGPHTSFATPTPVANNKHKTPVPPTPSTTVAIANSGSFDNTRVHPGPVHTLPNECMSFSDELDSMIALDSLDNEEPPFDSRAVKVKKTIVAADQIKPIQEGTGKKKLKTVTVVKLDNKSGSGSGPLATERPCSKTTNSSQNAMEAEPKNRASCDNHRTKQLKKTLTVGTFFPEAECNQTDTDPVESAPQEKPKSPTRRRPPPSPQNKQRQSPRKQPINSSKSPPNKSGGNTFIDGPQKTGTTASIDSYSPQRGSCREAELEGTISDGDDVLSSVLGAFDNSLVATKNHKLKSLVEMLDSDEGSEDPFQNLEEEVVTQPSRDADATPRHKRSKSKWFRKEFMEKTGGSFDNKSRSLDQSVSDGYSREDDSWGSFSTSLESDASVGEFEDAATAFLDAVNSVLTPLHRNTFFRQT